MDAAGQRDINDLTDRAVLVAGLGSVTLDALRQRRYLREELRAHPREARRGVLMPEHEAKVERTIAWLLPLGRPGMPEEMKGLLLWLAFDASSSVGGQILIEDGGYPA